MLHETKGIVLRNVKYGETSLVVTIYTELFGLQSYLINGVRSEKRSSARANLYQPTGLLELIVYHHPNRNLQRIKEAKLLAGQHFQGSTVVRYAIGIFMAELIQKAITETESNTDLYHFFEESFLHVLQADEKSLAGFAIWFACSFAEHLGFGMQNNFSEQMPVFDLLNGHFTAEDDLHNTHRLDSVSSQQLSSILHGDQAGLHLNGKRRHELLMTCVHYLQLHIPHLAEIKSVAVLHEIMN